MNCPNCGSTVAPGDAFCGSCGARLGQQNTQPPDQGMPQQPQMPPSAQGASPQQGVRSAVQPPPPPPRSGKGIVIILVILALLGLCTCAGLGGWFYYVSQVKKAVNTSQTPLTTPETTTSTTPTGTPDYATAEEALKADLPAGWEYTLASETPERMEYWVGPSANEWTTVYVIQRGTDGTWAVAEAYAYSQGLDDQTSTDQDAYEARQTVVAFLKHIAADEATEAHDLTVQPFSDDPASASFSNGDFYSFKVEDTIDDGDGTYTIVVTEDWAYGTDTNRYHVISTDAGWRIDGLVVEN